MFNQFHKRKKKLGMSPGALIHVGKHSAEPMTISLMTYNENDYQEIDRVDIQACATEVSEHAVKWIQVKGVHHPDFMQTLGDILHVHPLALEDVMTTSQRPKVDDYTDYLFIILRLLNYNEETGIVDDEQVSLILGKNFLVSFQERESTIFDSLKERLRLGKGLIRKQNADFLAYAIMDTIVDHYFLLIENMGAKIEDLEEKITNMATATGLRAIHQLRREIVFLRKALLPMREVINRLQRDDMSELFGTTAKFYLKDVYDHIIQVIDTTDAFRDLGRGLLDINISQMSYRMNEVIKTLTIVSTIFVPLTFITSFYGMNFVYLPGLQWHYSFPAACSVMLLVALFMIRYFKKKKWF